jgi:hypothetical protein
MWLNSLYTHILRWAVDYFWRQPSNHDEKQAKDSGSNDNHAAKHTFRQYESLALHPKSFLLP